MSIFSAIKNISAGLSDAVVREINFHRVRPTIATLFLTYRCNSRCMTCTMWQRHPETEMAREIGIDEWKVIIDKIAEAGIRIVEVFGGNVLLRKDLLIELLYYMREKDFVIHLPTNQIGLDEDIARAIADTVDIVYISTDGVGGSQDAIRGVSGSGSRVESAVEMLKRMKKNGRPSLFCNTTISKYNVAEIEKIAEYAVASGFDQMHFEYVGEMTNEHIEHSLVDGLKPTPYYLQQGESVLIDSAQAHSLKEKLPGIKKRFKGCGIYISSVNVDVLTEKDLSEGTIPNRKCYVERNEVTVDPYGNAVGCLFINNYILGNLVTDSFKDVWNNSRHRRFREIQNSEALEMCRHCILGAQRNPSFLTSLKRMYLSKM